MRALSAIKFLRDKIEAANTRAGSRIYTGVAPQSAIYPLVVMEIISNTESPTQDSGSAVDTFRIQIDVWAQNTSSMSGFEEAVTTSDEIRTAISRQTDTANYTNDIDGVQEVNFLSDFIPELELYRITTDYMVRVK